MSFESLERRLLLDSGLSRLADDFFDVRQNDASQHLDVLANDIFDNGYAGERQITSVSYGSEGGRIELTDHRDAIEYAPPADFSGRETFVYFVDNELSGTVTITIRSPLASDTYQILPDEGPQTLDVLANDPFGVDYGGLREISSVSETSLGAEVAVAEDGKSIIYSPPSDAYGKDTFVYIVDEIYPARVTIEIPNPLEHDRYREIVQNSDRKVLNVLANDRFWPGYEGARRITFVSETSNGGSVTIEEGGQSVVFSPASDYNGWDRFTYVVDNLFEASVEVEVHRPVRDDWFGIDTNTTNHPLMVTDNDSFSYWEDGRQTTRDVVERVTSVGQTEHGGTVVIMANGQGVLYSAPPDFEGTDTFEYVADGKHSATVTVEVTSPVRDDFIYGEVFEDTVDNVLDVLSNDFRGNGYVGARVITSVEATSEGAIVSIAEDGHSVLFTPSPGFRGTDSFTYAVDDELEAEVRVQVGAIAKGDYFQYCPNPSVTEFVLDVLTNDHFGMRYPGPGIITSVGETANGGGAEISANGKSIRFTPVEGGTDSFSYTVDGQYEASVSVYFKSHLSGDSFVVDQNSTNNELMPLTNDFRYTRWSCGTYVGPRQITSVGPAEHGGTVTLAADGETIHYVPAPDFSGDDHFTYTVDGVMQEGVSVHVVRRVRDDVFRVAPESHENVLPVLVNDLFGADYSGAGRITTVTETSAQATVSVSDDGAVLYYTPPAGFTGEDTLTYTVDGALKADVTVWVSDSTVDVLPRFGSSSEFQQFLIDDALERYEGFFGREADYDRYFRIDDSLNGPELASFEVDAQDGRSHSETNVQVAGVDEGDIIETDGDYLYILRDTELVIADAWPADQLSIASRVGIEGSTIAEYLHGDRLTVISQTWDFGWGTPYPMPYDGLVASDWRPRPRTTTTWVTVFDVADRGSPSIVQQTKLDGTYVESRRMDDFVFLVLRNNEIRLPRPEWICDSGEDGGNGASLSTCVYESREQYIERMTAQMGSFLDSALPHYTSYGPDGELVRSGLLDAPEDVFRAASPDDRSLVSIISLNMGGDEPGIAASAGVFTSGADKIYGSRANLFVFDDEYTSEDGAATRIMKFDWDSETGTVEFAARGQVAGRMLDQFSADEYDGSLRIATTVSNSYSGNFSGRSENVLFVLRDDEGVLEFVGGMQNLALEESIRSVRFMGPRAFVTTFRDIDPLFAVDLSDPAHPTAVGHITMPGFNSYMQFIDDTHILAVGRNTPIGNTGPTQVSLFDVGDLSQPRLIDRYTFERFSTSEAEADHHAFGWFAEHEVLAMPSMRGYWQRVDEDGDGYRETRSWIREDELLLFTIDVAATRHQGGGIRLLGEIGHESPVRRSAYIDDVLYSIAENSVQAVNIADPTIQFGWIELGDETDTPGIDGSSSSTERPLADVIRAATDHLAQSMGTYPNAVMAIAAESALWSEGCIGTGVDSCGGSVLPGFRVVLGIGDDRYLYHTDTKQDVTLADESFQFEASGNVWHNFEQPEDINQDSLVTPIDALVAINELNRRGVRRLSTDRVLRQIDSTAERLLDVSGDEWITPLDVLMIVDRLNSSMNSGGEPVAEGEWLSAVVSSTVGLASSATGMDVGAPATRVIQWGQPVSETATWRDHIGRGSAAAVPGVEDVESVLDDIADDLSKRSSADRGWDFEADLLAELSWLTEGNLADLSNVD